LQAAAIKQLAIHPNLVFSIRNHPNKAFLVKAYLAIDSINLDDEIAVCIDGQATHNRCNLSSDLCKEDGSILNDGPSTTVSMQLDDADFDAAIEVWLERFDTFLSRSERIITKYYC
jgi:hypothetical protein